MTHTDSPDHASASDPCSSAGKEWWKSEEKWSLRRIFSSLLRIMQWHCTKKVCCKRFWRCPKTTFLCHFIMFADFTSIVLSIYYCKCLIVCFFFNDFIHSSIFSIFISLYLFIIFLPSIILFSFLLRYLTHFPLFNPSVGASDAIIHSDAESEALSSSLASFCLFFLRFHFWAQNKHRWERQHRNEPVLCLWDWASSFILGRSTQQFISTSRHSLFVLLLLHSAPHSWTLWQKNTTRSTFLMT